MSTFNLTKYLNLHKLLNYEDINNIKFCMLSIVKEESTINDSILNNWKDRTPNNLINCVPSPWNRKEINALRRNKKVQIERVIIKIKLLQN